MEAFSTAVCCGELEEKRSSCGNDGGELVHSVRRIRGAVGNVDLNLC